MKVETKENDMVARLKRKYLLFFDLAGCCMRFGSQICLWFDYGVANANSMTQQPVSTRRKVSSSHRQAEVTWRWGRTAALLLYRQAMVSWTNFCKRFVCMLVVHPQTQPEG